MDPQLISDSSCSSWRFGIHRRVNLSLSSHQLMMISPGWTGQMSQGAKINEILPNAAGLRKNRHLLCYEK